MHDERPPHGRRTLESFRKEARRWLDALREPDSPDHSEARARLARALPDAARSATDVPTLREVQHALALEHGFAGWTALRQHVSAAAAQVPDSLAIYETMAAALLEAYDTGTPEAMQRHWSLTWHRRAWKGMRTYVQVDLGKVAGDDVAITIDDARYLVAREQGFANWQALIADVAARPSHGLHLNKPVSVQSHQPLPLSEFTVAESPSPSSGARAAGVPRAVHTNYSRRWNDVRQMLADEGAMGLDAHGQMTDALLAEIVTLPHLTRLSFGGSSALTDDGVQLLARMPNLRQLDLSGTAITDRGMAALGHLTSLEKLSLAWTRVTDAGIASLAPCRSLQEVNLAGSAAGDGALRALGGRETLRTLYVGGRTTDAGLRFLHDFPVFKDWKYSGGREVTIGYDGKPNQLTVRGAITDRGFAALRGLDGLFSLDVDDEALGLSGQAVVPLLELPNLGSLAFDARDDSMPVIGQLPNLRWLGCQDTSASDDGWVALAKSRSIERIWGRRCYGLSDGGFRALSTMPSLQSFSASCRNVSDEALAAFPDFPALVELMPMDVPDAGYRHIARCTDLRTLTLMYCRDTTDAATEWVVGLRALTKYFASYTQITDRTPRLLATMNSLEEVTFDSCAGLTNDGVAALARLPRLREVRVSGRGLTEEVVGAFRAGVEVRYHL